jgi:HPt (histidine-containing phosphotransfer) domain-containing protein
MYNFEGGGRQINTWVNSEVMNTGVMQKSSVETIKVHLAEQFSLSEEQVEMMLPSFLATLGTHMEKLETALAENNPVLLGKIGHTIKGAFLNLGLIAPR